MILISGYDKSCLAIDLSDSNIIPDSSFIASSEFDDTYYVAHKARFSVSDGCWAPKYNNNTGDYLQIDLGQVFVICAVATKGNPTPAPEWTTEYKILTSIDNKQWMNYTENSSSPKLFTGNNDSDTAVKNTLIVPVLAKFIRFIPTKYKKYKALRVEVYGNPIQDFSCSSLPVGVASVAKIPDNRMTSSSQYSSSTPPSNGRLRYTAGSSWCAATSDSSPYLQVQLGSPYIICGVATQGDHKSDNGVQTYQIQTSTDGSSFTDYKHNSIVQEFSGNVDRDTIVKNPLYEGSVGGYVRFKPKSYNRITSCMRTELYGVQQNTVCSTMSVGVSYASLVPDHRFTASSYYISSFGANRYLPSKARLRAVTAWKPGTDDVNAINWLQIDLGSVVYVCAVATQGNGYLPDEWAKKYKLRVSLDNVNWEYYKENNVDKVFTGNTDKNTIGTDTLAIPTKTKFIRFYPTEFNGYAAMRVDVYGVPTRGIWIETACNSPFGVENGRSIVNIKMTSSSQSDSAHAASFGRLYGSASWCSNVQANTEYLQVDLGKMITLTGIATQGDNTTDKWVKTYTLKYSINGIVWIDYREGQASAKIFQGNTDKSSIVVRWFTNPVTVRYAKVFPQIWNIGICMRVELFGCKYPSPPEITGLSNKNLPVSSGSHVDFNCTVKEPLIQYINWYSDGNDVTNLSGGITRTATAVQSVLRVNFTSAKDVVNNYKCSNVSVSSVACKKNIVCRAKYAKDNSCADSVRGALVQVNLEKPSALGALSVGNILSTSAVVSWTQPALKPTQTSITSYTIKYGNQSTAKVVIAASGDRSKTISGLSACTDYNLTITSYTSLGPGPWSAIKTFKADSIKPNVAVSGVNAVARTSQSIDVTWQVLSGSHCPPTTYKVTYSKTSGGGAQEVIVNGSQSTSTTLKNLEKWTEYSITVKSRNGKGDGPASSAVVSCRRTLEDTPTKPINVVASILLDSLNGPKIKVDWKPPVPPNGIIRGYRISYGPTTGDENTNSIDKNTRTHTFDACGGVTYKVKVWAYTVADGSKEETTTAAVPNFAPGSPRNLKVFDITITTAKLRWLKPQPLIKPVEKYIITYHWKKTYKFLDTDWPDNKISDVKEYDSPPTTDVVTFTMTGLYPGTRYRFAVSAETECGRGNNTDEVLKDTPIAAPPPPSVGTVNNITSSVGNITLWRILPINGEISGILVYIREVKKRKRKRRAEGSSIPRCEDIAQDAAELEPTAKIFTLGDGKEYGNYKNQELEKGKSFEVFQCGKTGKTEFLYGGVAKIAEGTIPLNKDDVSINHTQEAEKCTLQTCYIILAVIVGVQLVIIILLLVYIRHLRNKVKVLLTERIYEEKTPDDEASYENNTLEQEKPPEGIEMSDITSNISPIYASVDNPSRLPHPTVGQLQESRNTKSSSSRGGDTNTTARSTTTASKPNIQKHHHKLLSTEVKDDSLVYAEPSLMDKSYMCAQKQSRIPPSSHGGLSQITNKSGTPSSHLALSSLQLNKARCEEKDFSNKPQHTLPPPTERNTSSSFSKDSSGVYQPLGLREQVQDSDYEELNQTTMSRPPLSQDQSDDRSLYQPLQGNIQSPTYEHLRLSERSPKTDVQI